VPEISLGRLTVALFLTALIVVGQTPPEPGPVEILPLSEVKPGMRATAWTTFKGTAAESMPVEILGVMQNAWGPRQDIILAKVGGKGDRTNVAGGMSGSPVYYDGKLLGAISLRFSVFSPDSIAGITPIELMLEIDELDRSLPRESSTAAASEAAVNMEPNQMANEVWAAVGAEIPPNEGSFQAIETPLAVSGLYPQAFSALSGYFAQQGYRLAQAGAAARELPQGDPDNALKPGEPIAAVLLSGDMSATALGTVSYNDGNRVLGFGHAMFNSGPIEAPIATGEVIHVLASEFSPVKIANASAIVGALRQDRHSGIMGVLGETVDMAPMSVRIRTLDRDDEVTAEKEFRFQVFRNEKWTPQLVMMALFNSLFGVNDFAEETTYRLNAKIGFDGGHQLAVSTLQSTPEQPIPAPLLLAASVAGRMRQVFANTSETARVSAVDVEIDLLAERRTAVIEGIWVDRRRARPGDLLTGRATIVPFRGDRFEKEFQIRIPETASKGRLNLVVSDSSLPNRKRQLAAQRLKSMSLPLAVSLLNQENRNDRIYVSLTDRSPTAHVGDRSMPNLPLTSLAVMRPSASGRLALELGSPLAQTSIEVGSLVTGTRTLSIAIE